MFSRDETVVVGSVVYNLAGDEARRVKFLQNTVLTGVFLDSPSLGESINQAYLRGPGINLRQYSNWVNTSGYKSTIGYSGSSLRTGDQIDNSTIQTQIPKPAGTEIRIQSSTITNANYRFWAEQYMMENHIDLYPTEWTSTYASSTKTVTIIFEDETTESFTIPAFEFGARYMYVYYSVVTPTTAGPITPGDPVDIGSDPFPSTAGWTLDSSSVITTPVELTTTTTVSNTYSDGRPEEVTITTSSTSTSYDAINLVYSRLSYIGGSVELESLKETQYQIQSASLGSDITETVETEDIGGGVIKTITTEVEVESLNIDRSYRIDTQTIKNEAAQQTRLFIYRENGGNPALDWMFYSPVDQGDFIPVIPIIYNDRFISDTYYPAVYKANKNAYRHLIDNSYAKLIKNVADNDDIDKINYAYIVPGVALNTKDPSGKRYIYEFFKQLRLGYPQMSLAYDEWRQVWAVADAEKRHWVTWRNAQANPADPLFGTPEPSYIPYPPEPSWFTLKVQNGFNYDVTITWSALHEDAGIGLIEPGAKKGDVTITQGDIELFEELYPGYTSSALALTILVAGTIVIRYQLTENSWIRLTLINARHYNNIYRGEFAWTPAYEALTDTDESSFIIPLQENILKDMPLRHSTQVGTFSNYIVFNCYEIHRQKWYQTAFFQFFFMSAVMFISAYFMAPGAASAGVMGSNATVGAALGFTGANAILVGAAANAIASIVLMRVVTEATRALLGDKIGTIVGAIAGAFVIRMTTNYMSGQSITANFGELLKAENILKLTASVGDGITSYMQAAVQNTVQDTMAILEDYKVKSAEISEAYTQQFGSNFMADPLLLTDSLRSNTSIESPISFLERTLMTGNDIADFSLNGIGRFTEITLSTQLP